MGVMLTTTDNPFDPFTQRKEWYGWDLRAGYNTPGLLARVVGDIDELSDEEQETAIEDAMDRIVSLKASGVHRKVTQPDEADSDQPDGDDLDDQPEMDLGVEQVEEVDDARSGDDSGELRTSPQVRARMLAMAQLRAVPEPDDDDPVGELSVEAAAIVAALELFDEFGRGDERRKDPLRIPKGHEGGGRFRKITDLIFQRLEDWAAGKGPDNPFEGQGFTREHLREAAKARGIPLRRGVSENELVNLLLEDRRGKSGKKPDVAAKDAPTSAPAKKTTPVKKVAAKPAAEKPSAERPDIAAVLDRMPPEHRDAARRILTGGQRGVGNSAPSKAKALRMDANVQRKMAQAAFDANPGLGRTQDDLKRANAIADHFDRLADLVYPREGAPVSTVELPDIPRSLQADVFKVAPIMGDSPAASILRTALDDGSNDNAARLRRKADFVRSEAERLRKSGQRRIDHSKPDSKEHALGQAEIEGADKLDIAAGVFDEHADGLTKKKAARGKAAVAKKPKAEKPSADPAKSEATGDPERAAERKPDDIQGAERKTLAADVVKQYESARRRGRTHTDAIDEIASDLSYADDAGRRDLSPTDAQKLVRDLLHESGVGEVNGLMQQQVRARVLALTQLRAAPELDDEPDDDEPDDEVRAMNPDQLKHYWTRDPEGLAKWAKSPHPWTALYRRLRKYVGSERAKRMASDWHKEVFGIWVGEKKGKNPLGPG